MKKNLFVTLTLAIVLAFSMAVIACDDGSDNSGGSNSGGNGGGGNGGGGGGGSASTLTITDIPATYNGKYAFFFCEGLAMGCQSVDYATHKITLVQISNGRVSLPMWTSESGAIVKYTGNDAVPARQQDDCYVAIFNTSTSNLNSYEREAIAAIGFLNQPSITFSNGSATVSANAGTLTTF